MTQFVLHFVDPTIPGLSGRDLMAGRAQVSGSTAAARKDLAIRKALAGLDRHQLQDLGLDHDTV